LELELVGRLAPGLSALAGYAWTETEITRDTLGSAGRELPNAPHHKASAWVRYRFAPDVARGVMVAAGVVHVSKRFTNRDNAVVAPGYTRVDASASWEVMGPRVTLGVVCENLTDLRYVRSGSAGVLFAGPPRRLAIQMTTAF
jgi:iron complex outermembrane receptor protein